MKIVPLLLITIFLGIGFLGAFLPRHTVEGATDTSWYRKPESYNELVTWYQKLEENYSRYIEIFKVNEIYGTGKVDGNYDLFYVRITNESRGFQKPETLFLGGPHGDETVGTVGLYWFTDWLMRYAYHPDFDNPEREWLQWLIDHREIYIEISHNPYGFDHTQRYDRNGWDLNREADYDGPGPSTGGIWASVNGRTLRQFIDHHAIRTGADFHGGARMLLYPWSSNHDTVQGTSPLSNVSYTHAPPDFYFYDAVALRVGDYMGDYGGNLNAQNSGPIPDTVGYEAPGALAPWAYGADIQKNPQEDEYVNDENFGNYPGAGILWITPELSTIKNPPGIYFGSDTVPGYGQEVRWFLLHQIDLAQPYLWWVAPQNNTLQDQDSVVSFQWEVNGCLVTDQTCIQWGTHPDPINNPGYITPVHNEYHGMYVGGTGWDSAENGKKTGVMYQENVTLEKPGDYYFVAKAQVDQIYGVTLAPELYGENHTYLRLIKERVNDTYLEEINGTDGVECARGQLWWYSPIWHIRVGIIEKPRPGYLYIFNREIVPTLSKKTLIIGDILVTVAAPEIIRTEFYVDDELRYSTAAEPYQWLWDETVFGVHDLEVRMYREDGKSLIQRLEVTIFNTK